VERNGKDMVETPAANAHVDDARESRAGAGRQVSREIVMGNGL